MVKNKGPVNLGKSLILNVDIQRAFGEAFGEKAASEKLRGLRATEDDEVEKAARLSQAVHEAGGTVVATKDWHNKPGTQVASGKDRAIDQRSVEEFGIYGEHAVAGSPDAELNRPLEETLRRLEREEGTERAIVPVDRFDPTGRSSSARVIEVHKNTYDVTKRLDLDGKMRPHQGFVDLLAKVKKQGIDTVIVTGKIAEVCVRAALESIHQLHPDLRLVAVEDAISSLPRETAKLLHLDPKEEVLGALEDLGASVVRADQLLPSKEEARAGVLGQ